MEQAAIWNSNTKPVASVSPRQLVASPRRQQYLVGSLPTPDADPEDYSRRLKISSSPSPSPRPPQSTKAMFSSFSPDTYPFQWDELTPPFPFLDKSSRWEGLHRTSLIRSSKGRSGSVFGNANSPTIGTPLYEWYGYSIMGCFEELAIGFHLDYKIDEVLRHRSAQLDLLTVLETLECHQKQGVIAL